MCVVSAIGDEWNRRIPEQYPWLPFIQDKSSDMDTNPAQRISREEFNALRKEVRELKELLLAAKRFDEATGQPDCEMAEKIEMIRKIAEWVGVDMDEVFG